MTYTTEEKRTITELRHKSKMAALDKIAQAETEYNKATANHKATFDKKIAAIEQESKETLKVAIKADLAVSQTGEEDDIDDGDSDE